MPNREPNDFEHDATLVLQVVMTVVITAAVLAPTVWVLRHLWAWALS